MSGWSRSTVTILAARRVVPPDLMAPAARSPIFRNDIRPEERPPPDSDSPSPRRAEKLRSEEHTSEPQSLMRLSYAVSSLKKRKSSNTRQQQNPSDLQKQPQVSTTVC